MQILHRRRQHVDNLEQILLLHQIHSIPDDKISHRVFPEMKRQKQKIFSALRVIEGRENPLHDRLLALFYHAVLIGELHLHFLRITVHAELFILNQMSVIIIAQFPEIIHVLIHDQIHRVTPHGRNTFRNPARHLPHRLALQQFILQRKHLLLKFIRLDSVDNLSPGMFCLIHRNAGVTAAAFPENTLVPRIIKPRYRLAPPQPQKNIRTTVSHLLADMPDRCDVRGIIARFVKIIESGHQKIVGRLVAVGCRRLAHADGDVIVGADNGVRKFPVQREQFFKSMHSTLVFITLAVEIPGIPQNPVCL